MTRYEEAQKAGIRLAKNIEENAKLDAKDGQEQAKEESKSADEMAKDQKAVAQEKLDKLKDVTNEVKSEAQKTQRENADPGAGAHPDEKKAEDDNADKQDEQDEVAPDRAKADQPPNN